MRVLMLTSILCAAVIPRTVQAAGTGDSAPKKCTASDVEYTVTDVVPTGVCSVITDTINVGFNVNIWGNPQRYNLAVGYTNSGDNILQDVSCLNTGIDLDSVGCEDYNGSGTVAAPLVAQSSFDVSCDLDGDLLVDPLVGVDFYISFDASSGGTIPEITSPKCLEQAGTTFPLLPAKLQLNKSVINDSGGSASVTDWILTAAQVGGTLNLSGTDGVADNTLPAGNYLLSETGPSQYTLDSISCTGAAFDPATAILTLGAGDNAQCEFVNNDAVVIPGTSTLSLVKTVVNDNGGSATLSDFDLFIDGVVVASGATVPVSANVDIQISELDLPAYNEGTWNCVDNNAVTSGLPTNGLATGTVVNLASGAEVVCTIENNDKGVDLSVVKSVDNNAPSVGDDIQFELLVANAGPDEATDVSVVDILPAGFSYVAGSISGADSSSDTDPTGVGLQWTINSLLANDSTVLQFTATVIGP